MIVSASSGKRQAGTHSRPVRVGYLVNRYPAISHTFIRREIAALERHGVVVERYGIRPPDESFVDPADIREQARTRSILAVGLLGVALAILRQAVTQPLRLARALKLAWRVWRRSKRSLAVHLAYLGEACVLQPWTQQAGIEHLHVHFATNPTTVAMLCRELGGPPYSFTVHGPEEFDRAVILALDEKIARAVFVIAITHYCRAQLMRWCGSEHWDKLKLVRCGLADDFLEAPSTPCPSARRLVSVGRLCEQKAPLVLVEAAGRLATDGVDFELVLVGDGEMRPQVERRIAQLGLTGRVRITGWASNGTVLEQIRDARALILPSFAEGLPAVVMEALALARPVITTYIAGHPELVRPGRNGWLVPAGAVEQTAAAMREAIEAPPRRLDRMGRMGRALVRDLHNARASTAQLAAHIRAALGLPPPPLEAASPLATDTREPPERLIDDTEEQGTLDAHTPMGAARR